MSLVQRISDLAIRIAEEIKSVWNAIDGISTHTTDSIVGDGSVENPVKLFNDSDSPGSKYYYGTNKTGDKGFYPLPDQGEDYFMVYNESELLNAWNVAAENPDRGATIYIAGDIQLTANRAFLIGAGEAGVTFQGVGNSQKILIGSFEFKISRVTCRNLYFRTDSQVYVTVDQHYADFYDCIWGDEQFYSPTFSQMKIAIKLTGTIINNTGRIVLSNARHVSSTSYAINTGNIQPFIISNEKEWITSDSRQMYIFITRQDAVLSFDRFSQVLLHASAGVPYKVTGDLTWFYHSDQQWPGSGNILVGSELLKRGSVDDLRGDFVPEGSLATMLGIDSEGKIRKGSIEFAASNHNHDNSYDPLGAAASHVSSHEANFDHDDLHSHPNKTDLDSYNPASFASAGHNHDSDYEPKNSNIQSHINSTSNPHGVSKTQVGLGNVDNTSDADKPVSTAQQAAFDGKADSGHNHDNDYEPKFSKNSAFNKNFGTSAGTVCEGNDSRLSNARPPTAHNHDDRYYTESEVDSKLADKANVSHHHDSEYADINHNHSGTYEPAFSKNSAFNKNFGSAAGTVCQGNDSRLSNQRTPTDNSVDTGKLAARYKNIIGMTGVDVDWSAGQVFTKTLSANSTLAFSNLHVGVKDLEITGSYTLALPSGFKLISGEYDGSVLNFIQIVCTDPSTPKGWVVISQEAS